MAPSTPSKLSRFDLPGFTLPLNFAPEKACKKRIYDAASSIMEEVYVEAPGWRESDRLFPTALSPNDGVGSSQLPLTTLREFTMIQMMNQITDKPHWETKVFDDQIVAKWEAESHGASRSEGRDITPSTFKWIIEELRYKAKIFDETKMVSLYNGDVVKSDIKVPESLKEALKSLVRPLEDISDVYKDYHPRSDNKVIDLVHPSLFPLIYGRSRMLPDKIVGLDDCLEMIGLGNVLPSPPESEINYREYSLRVSTSSPYSRNYQWLPCEVDFSGPNEEVKITSYINNLHPRTHQDLYVAIEQIISHAIPLWNLTLTPLKDPRFQWNRIGYSEPRYDPDPEHMTEEEGKLQKRADESEDDFWDRYYEWEAEFRRAHCVQPEPGDFKLPQKTITSHAAEAVDLKRDYGDMGLQVIVKLATISLTPEKPSYEGGSWHVEGQLNEHICATALYYYDSVNITKSRLAFRQQSCEDDTTDIMYNQNDSAWAMPIFGIENDEACVQDVGDVVCKEGRLITFPNVLQHRVLPFELEDQSKPGHRKILALFLVDPNIRVISTANVPPQQREWWSEELKTSGCFKQLAAELQDQVFKGVDDFPIGMDEAKEIRLKLMDERREYVVQQNKEFQSLTLSLCEH